MRNRTYLFLLISTLIIQTASVAADEFEKIEVLDKPRFTLKDKLTLDLDLSFLPLDAYYKPVLLEVAANYQFNDFFQLEALRFGLSLINFDTGFEKSIESIIAPGQRIEDQALKTLRYRVSSAGFFNLLYSKSNFFNSAVAYHYWQIGGGFSYYDMKIEKQMGLDLIMRVRFFLDERTTFNIRAGHTIGLNPNAPRNISFIGLGVGYAF
jgi:hypothetical protein